MKKVLGNPKKCPNCKADFTGELIPKKYRDKGWYGKHTHYSRVIGLYDMDQDRTIAYRCPDCGYEWPRV